MGDLPDQPDRLLFSPGLAVITELVPSLALVPQTLGDLDGKGVEQS